MTDETIDADEVEQELPADWWAENDGETTVYAYAPQPSPAASVTIEPADGGCLWTAVWNTMGGSGFHEPSDSVEGTKERAVQWVADKAAGAGP